MAYVDDALVRVGTLGLQPRQRNILLFLWDSWDKKKIFKSPEPLWQDRRRPPCSPKRERRHSCRSPWPGRRCRTRPCPLKKCLAVWTKSFEFFVLILEQASINVMPVSTFWSLPSAVSSISISTVPMSTPPYDHYMAFNEKLNFLKPKLPFCWSRRCIWQNTKKPLVA